MKNIKSTAMAVPLITAASVMAPVHTVMAEDGPSWNISGWINESATYYDDGVKSDVVQSGDNGTTLGSRITLSGSTPLSGTGLTAGFEVTMEPTANNASGASNNPLTVANQEAFENGNGWPGSVSLLGNSVNVSGAFGKFTLGTQSMPTDNIAVLADPSLTLWSSISPVFRGNGFDIQGLAPGTTAKWGSFLQCLGVPGLGIGLDCNGIYRNGIRYDTPAFGPVSVAVGYANDDVFDVAVKYSGTIGGLTANVHGGYSYNADGGTNTGGKGSDTFQIQAGLMDPASGIFGLITYQKEEADNAAANSGDDTDAYWVKGGIKKNWTGFGDTSISLNYGSYNDQFAGTAGVTGSEVQRYGVSVDQYFGSNLIIYGLYRKLSLDVEGPNAALYSGADDLDTFTLGLTYFF